jgi:O-antigen ligase
VALRSSVIQALFIINAVLLPTLPRSEAEFARICRLAVLAALALAYFGVMMLPHVSIHQASDPAEPMLAGLWRGHFVHKNAASSAMALAVFFGIYSYATGARLLGIAMVAAATYFLVHTGGKTSLVTMPAIILLAWLVERFSLLRLPLILGGVIAFNVATLGAAVSPAISDAIASLGIDATFTNRVDIWRIALRLAAESPLTGEGLHTFWRSYAAVYGGGTIETWAYSAGTAHNGYLDVAMHLGLPGLLLVVLIFVLRPITQISQAMASGNDTALTRLFLRIWLFGVFNACVESIFFARGSVLWFVFMVAVFGLQLQAKARLVPSSTIPRSRGAVAHA